jgi:hypothetical protein
LAARRPRRGRAGGRRRRGPLRADGSGRGASRLPLAATDRILDFNPAAGDLLALRGQAAGTVLDAIAAGTFAPPGGPLLPVGFGGALTPAAAPEAGLALPDPMGGAAWLLHWLPSAAPGEGGGWLVLDADRGGSLSAADLVLRLDLPAGAAITAADFVPGTFASPAPAAPTPWRAATETTPLSASAATTCWKAAPATTPFPAATGTTACSAAGTPTRWRAARAPIPCSAATPSTCSAAATAATGWRAATARTSCAARPGRTRCSAALATTRSSAPPARTP